MAWFTLDPNSTDPTKPENYTLATGTPSCGGQNRICAVQAENDGSNKPELTEELKDEMIIALHNRSDRTDVKLRT